MSKRRPVLTERLRETLVWICSFKLTHDGVSPTVREICAGLGVLSTSIVSYRLDRLEQLGLIQRGGPEAGSRCIEVSGARWEPPEELAGDIAAAVEAEIARRIEDVSALLAESKPIEPLFIYRDDGPRYPIFKTIAQGGDLHE